GRTWNVRARRRGAAAPTGRECRFRERADGGRASTEPLSERGRVRAPFERGGRHVLEGLGGGARSGARADQGRVSRGVCTVRRRRRLRAAGRLALRRRELNHVVTTR